MIAKYTGVVKWQSFKNPDNYEKYSVCLSLDEDSLKRLKEAGFTGTIGEENAVWFNRGNAPQFEEDKAFGPVPVFAGPDKKEEEIPEVPGVGSTIVAKVVHFTSKKGKNKGKTSTKLLAVKVLDLVESDRDEDAPF